MIFLVTICCKNMLATSQIHDKQLPHLQPKVLYVMITVLYSKPVTFNSVSTQFRLFLYCNILGGTKYATLLIFHISLCVQQKKVKVTLFQLILTKTKKKKLCTSQFFVLDQARHVQKDILRYYCQQLQPSILDRRKYYQLDCAIKSKHCSATCLTV